MPVYTWLDFQRMSYGFGYGSFLVPGGLVHALGGSHLRHLIISSLQRICWGGMVLIIIVQHQERGVIIGLPWPWP